MQVLSPVSASPYRMKPGCSRNLGSKSLLAVSAMSPKVPLLIA
jgi:hypothetical protein